MSTFRDLEVAHELTAGFALVCLLLITITTIGILRPGQAHVALDDLSTTGLASVSAIDDVSAALITQRTSTVIPAAHKTAAAIETVATAEDDDTATAAKGRAAYRQTVIVLLGCAVAALLLAVVVATVVSRSITGPSSKVTVMEGLAVGRLDRRVGYTSADEVGRLSTATDTSPDSWSAAMREIDANAADLASSSEEMTAVANQLPSGAEDSAARSHLVSAATEQISASISTAAAGKEMSPPPRPGLQRRRRGRHRCRWRRGHH